MSWFSFQNLFQLKPFPTQRLLNPDQKTLDSSFSIPLSLAVHFQSINKSWWVHLRHIYKLWPLLVTSTATTMVYKSLSVSCLLIPIASQQPPCFLTLPPKNLFQGFQTGPLKINYVSYSSAKNPTSKSQPPYYGMQGSIWVDSELTETSSYSRISSSATRRLAVPKVFRLVPSWRSLHLSFPLPGAFFPQICSWFVSVPPSRLCSDIT